MRNNCFIVQYEIPCPNCGGLDCTAVVDITKMEVICRHCFKLLKFTSVAGMNLSLPTQNSEGIILSKT